MELSYIKPNWPVPDFIGSACSLRNGGFSTGCYNSFNLGLHVGDNPENVIKNRKKLQCDLDIGQGVIYLNQIHSTLVVSADLHMVEGNPVDADAIVTDKPNLGLAIMTADCLPVMFFDPTSRVIANAHAGWRGLCGGILENTLNFMNSVPSNVMVYLGPCIGPDAFEVGQEVREQFLNVSKLATKCFKLKENGKYLADLQLLARMRLESAGVKTNNIFGCSYCTVSSSDLFFSYRRDKSTGRMASVIWKNE